jgi:protein-S-isoprenylcysteine O-methyltransferase Ste14
MIQFIALAGRLLKRRLRWKREFYEGQSSKFMQIKGLDQLRKHIPDLNTPLGALRFFVFPIILFFLITFFFNTIRFTRPYWQLVAEILLGGLGFGLLYQFFRYKQDIKARFGPLAYRRAALLYGLPAVTIIAAVVARVRYLPGPEIPRFGWYIVLPALGWVSIVAGALLGLRTVQIFGVDNLTMLYVYFPEESQLVNHRIYNILRHPAYSAVQYIAFGLALLNGNWFAFACALIIAFGLWGWVRLVEEKELIERFGQAYVEYRQHVPPFLPRLRDLGGFIGFLIAGG